MKATHGFTLIELISVLLLVGILSAVVATRIASDGAERVQQSRDLLIAALFFAQQQAMDVDAAVALQVDATSINVTLDGTPTRAEGYVYPANLPTGVSLSPVTTFTYNRLGETTPASIRVLHTDGSEVTVTVAATGYAF